MRHKLKAEKRIAAEVAGILRVIEKEKMPPKHKNAIINKCQKILLTARKAQAYIDAPVGALFK